MCDKDTESFIVYIKTDDICKDIVDIEIRFDTSNHELECNSIERSLPNRKYEKSIIGLMKDELGGNIMVKFVGLRAKTYRYLIDEVSENKKSKRHKKVCHKKKA